MTIVFGRLVNEFNNWARGASSPEKLQAAVNKNACVAQVQVVGPRELM
jgi:hypothetical protein